jgi:hypothetical protein
MLLLVDLLPNPVLRGEMVAMCPADLPLAGHLNPRVRDLGEEDFGYKLSDSGGLPRQQVTRDGSGKGGGRVWVRQLSPRAGWVIPT